MYCVAKFIYLQMLRSKNFRSSLVSRLLPETLPSITVSEVKASRFRQYRKSEDIVAQFVHLSRTSAGLELWEDLAATVTQSVAKLRGEDMASVLRACAKTGFRNDLMLVALCESLKTLPALRLLRPRDIASILSSFHTLNFVPSVEVINTLSAEIIRSLPLYRKRSADLCQLFRYFSILANNLDLVLNYESEFENPRIVSLLETEIYNRIGSFGPIEVSIITKYAKRLTLKSLVENFARSENVSPIVHMHFIRQLDNRFGKNAWREFAHLFRLSNVDSTGWNRQSKPEDDSDEDDDIVSSHPRIKRERFQLDDAMVQEVLERVRGSRKFHRERKTESESVDGKVVPTLSDEQMEFLRSLEEELGMPAPRKQIAYADTVARDITRDIEESDLSSKKLSPELFRMKKFKERRNRRLFKFAVLSCMQRKSLG